MLEEYSVNTPPTGPTMGGRRLKLKVDKVGSVTTAVTEITLYKSSTQPTRTGTEETDVRKAIIYLSEEDFDEAVSDIGIHDIISYQAASIGPNTEQLKDFWF
jgi:hypothetical protein